MKSRVRDIAYRLLTIWRAGPDARGDNSKSDRDALDRLRHHVEHVDSGVARLDRSRSELETAIASIRDTLAGLQDHVVHVDGGVARLDRIRSDTESAIVEIDRRLATAQSQVHQNDTECSIVRRLVENVDARLSSLENRIVQLALHALAHNVQSTNAFSGQTIGGPAGSLPVGHHPHMPKSHKFDPGGFGVYFLSNDDTIEWTATFLASLRAKNPDLTIYHIPFDDNCKKTRFLLRDYDCREFDRPLHEYDAIGARFHPGSHAGTRCLRKLAIFSGPLEQFIYLDTDIVVNADLRPLAQRIFDSDYDICFYRHDHQTRNFANQQLVEFMDVAYPEYGTGKGFNTAFIASRRDAVPFDHIKRLAKRSDTLTHLFGVAWGDQPFTNFCAATAGLRGVRLPELMPEFAVNWDCFVDMAMDEATGCYKTGPNSPHRHSEVIHGPGGAIEGRIVPMIHWGGYERPAPDIPNYQIWRQFSRLRKPSTEAAVKPMPTIQLVRERGGHD